MADYKSNYTGPEIDELLGKAGTALQESDLSVFVAVYGETTRAEIDAAESAGKTILCDWSGFVLNYMGNGTFVGVSTSSSAVTVVKAWVTVGWDNDAVNLLRKSSDVETSLSASSTNNKVAGAKAAYDAIAAKYTKPAGGIPASDLANAVQGILQTADEVIPAAATSSNKLADRAWVQSNQDVKVVYIEGHNYYVCEDYERLPEGTYATIGAALDAGKAAIVVIRDTDNSDNPLQDTRVLYAADDRDNAIGAISLYEFSVGLVSRINLLDDDTVTVTTDNSVVKFTYQSGKTAEQKAQARSNIGAGTYSKPDGGIPAADLASGVIPSAPGTLDTNVTTAQSVKSSEALSGTIKLHKVSKTGSYNDLLNKPSIPAAQIQSDWDQSDNTALDYIKNKPTIPDTSNFVQKSQTAGLLKNDGTVDTTSYGTYSKPSGGIPASDLASAVQTSLGKADSAYQKPSGGIPAADLASGVIPTVPTISTNIATDKSSNTKTASPAAVYNEVHPAVGSSQPSGGMLPNVFYNLGTLSGNTTFAFAAASDANIMNEWMFQFTTPSTAPTITWPAAITGWLGGSTPTINASKTYQVSVVNGLGVIAEF